MLIDMCTPDLSQAVKDLKCHINKFGLYLIVIGGHGLCLFFPPQTQSEKLCYCLLLCYSNVKLGLGHVEAKSW